LSKGLIAACLRNFKLLNPPEFSRRLATTRNRNINFFTPGQKENMQICQETKRNTGLELEKEYFWQEWANSGKNSEIIQNTALSTNKKK